MSLYYGAGRLGNSYEGCVPSSDSDHYVITTARAQESQSCCVIKNMGTITEGRYDDYLSKSTEVGVYYLCLLLNFYEITYCSIWRAARDLLEARSLG